MPSESGEAGAEHFFAGVFAALSREGARPADKEGCDDAFFAGLSDFDCNSREPTKSPPAEGTNDLWAPASNSLKARTTFLCTRSKQIPKGPPEAQVATGLLSRLQRL